MAFGQWQAARRLVERGARTTLWQAAALGLIDRIEEKFTGETPPGPDEVNHAFWSACHVGQRRAADYLLDRGADRNKSGRRSMARAERVPANWSSGCTGRAPGRVKN